MKIVKRMLLVLLIVFIIFIISFIVYIAPNYKKPDYANTTNLIINYTNVTPKMKGRVIREDGEIYISLDDIKNYFDKYAYFDETYNLIVITREKNYICFDINKGTMQYNGKKSNKKIIKEDNLLYVPITCIDDVYYITVEYNEKNDSVVIKSVDRDIKMGKTGKKISIKSKATNFSRTIGKIDANTKIYIKNTEQNNDDVDNKNQIEQQKKGIEGIKQSIKNIKTNTAKDWTIIRTEDGLLGYIQNKDIKDIETIEYKANKVVKQEKISLVWDFYDSKYGSVPKVGENIKYEGINVVSPTCFFMKGSEVKEKVGEAGETYFNWAKGNGYKVWARVANESTNSDDMKAFSSWITDYYRRQDVINQIMNYVDKYNLDGINLDFEMMYEEDVDSLSRFIIELKPKLAQKNVILSVDVTEPDGSATWSRCYNRKTIGDVADYIVFMAYDQTSNKPKAPGSNSAYYWVERNIKKFINNEEVDPNKIIVALPFYSKLWRVFEDGTIECAANVSMKNQYAHVEKATKKEWLTDSKQNYIEYTGQANNKSCTYMMWIEDVQSISEKMNLIDQYDLAGVAFWSKGNEDQSIWDVVKNKILNK